MSIALAAQALPILRLHLQLWCLAACPSGLLVQGQASASLHVQFLPMLPGKKEHCRHPHCLCSAAAKLNVARERLLQSAAEAAQEAMLREQRCAPIFQQHADIVLGSSELLHLIGGGGAGGLLREQRCAPLPATPARWENMV